MPQSFVEFRGILKDQPSLERFPNGGIPEIYVPQNFSVKHDSREQLGNFIQQALQEIAAMNGMVVHKNEPHAQFDFNNQKFVPMHMFSRIDVVVKPITAFESNPDSDKLEDVEVIN